MMYICMSQKAKLMVGTGKILKLFNDRYWPKADIDSCSIND
ncbi:MAG: hypothetical protein ACI9N9_002954 [Enterobacterales bacterium]|jgi:hypothetical protein